MINSEYLDWLKQLVANAHEKRYEYIISRTKNLQKYFYYDFDYIGRKDETLYQLMWTPTQRMAFPFETEEEVEEFKAEYISPRKASIIRVIKPPHMMIEDLMG